MTVPVFSPDSAGALHPLREDGSMPATGGAAIAAEHTAAVDVTAWAVIRDEPGGRDPNKRWLAADPEAPRHEHWLWKSRQRTGDGSETALTDCAEVIVSRLARLIDLPAALCRFAVCDGEWGVISRNVTPDGFSLNTGAAYLPEVEGYERQGADSTGELRPGRMRRDRGYTLDAVRQVLTRVGAPPRTSGLSAFGVFAGYLVLDALTGNTDRHPGNWALLESDEDGTRYLAATYDHGSALGAGLTEKNRRTRRPKDFAAKGRANAFEPRGAASCRPCVRSRRPGRFRPLAVPTGDPGQGDRSGDTGRTTGPTVGGRGYLHRRRHT